MRKSPPIQISVPQPCSEDWNKMTPQEQGRFCDSCQKCVVDFTSFSDKDLYEYMMANRGKKVCGRFFNHQLNRNIILPPQPHSRLYNWIVAAGLALIITAVPNNPTFAQAPLTVATEKVNTNDDTTKHNSDNDYLIKGVVKDEYGEPMIGAIIQLIQEGVLKNGAVTDFDGNYVLSLSDKITGDFSLEVKYIGYKTNIVKGINRSGLDQKSRINFSMQPSDRVLSGDIIIIIDPPMLDPYNGGIHKTITSDEIESSPYR